MKFKEEVLIKLSKIEERQIEHTIQLQSNTKSLDEHHKRTTMLEARVAPIEHHVVFVGKSIKIFLSLLAAIAIGVLTKLIVH